MSVRIPLMLLLAACTTAPHQTPAALVPAFPTPAQTTDDSVVAAVLHKVVVEGLPDWRPRRTVVIQSDSGFVSPSSLPRVDSVGFVLLGAAEIQQLANQLGSVNALSVEAYDRRGYSSIRGQQPVGVAPGTRGENDWHERLHVQAPPPRRCVAGGFDARLRDYVSALPNKRLKLSARVDYGMNPSSARCSLSAIR